MEFYNVNDGNKFPKIALGTVDLKGAKGVQSIKTALRNGYELIDTSTNYNNEGAVGKAIRELNIPREHIQVSSKLPGANHEYDKAIDAIQESLYRIGIDYFDKYLIHWPLPKRDNYVEAWQALVDAQKFGLIKTIGVSNFLPEHLDCIIEATGVTPATNQIERHPYFNNLDLHQANKDRGILTEAWSPLGRELNDLLENKVLAEIAKKHGKSIAQVIIRWNIQTGILVNVKSGQLKHQLENIDVFDFELSQEEMALINQLDKGKEGLVEGQDPREYEEFN